MELVALLSRGEGTWAQVAGIIKSEEWENIILIGEEFARNFKVEGNKPCTFIELKSRRLVELKQEIHEKLQGKIHGTEVCLSIASGDGKEHMALISALLSLPVGVRFTALTKDGLVML
ncbi:MAG: hypothetical protein AABY22_29380 [Nanoarchaeota archaeon]